MLESWTQGMESLMQRARTTSSDIDRSEKMPVQTQELAVAGRLVAGIADKIWNPLAAIKTTAFAMRVSLPPGDPMRVDCDVISEEVDQVERSIQRFLDFARPPEPAFAPICLTQPIADAVALLARRAQGRGVQIEIHAKPDLVVQADRRQIEQVFVNLILNALQAMPAGGRITITARRKTDRDETEKRGNGETGKESLPNSPPLPFSGSGEGDGKWAEVEVSDTGQGIPEGLEGRIFEPFVTGREGGTGLGLAIVQNILERHDGRIAARNRPEGGASFSVTLPLREESKA